MSVSGSVVEQESGKPIAGLRVSAWDKDLAFDDHLGDAVTDSAGKFTIRFTEAQFRDFNETAPDVYIRIHDSRGERLLYSTEHVPRMNGDVHEVFIVKIARALLE